MLLPLMLLLMLVPLLPLMLVPLVHLALMPLMLVPLILVLLLVPLMPLTLLPLILVLILVLMLRFSGCCRHTQCREIDKATRISFPRLWSRFAMCVALMQICKFALNADT